MKSTSHEESLLKFVKPGSWTLRSSRFQLRRWSSALFTALLLLLLASSSFAQTQIITTVVGPTTPPLNLPLNQPNGIATDSKGNLYIADTNNCVVWQLPIGYQTATVFAGQLGNCGVAAPATTGTTLPTSIKLNYPLGVAACDGIVFILDQTSGSGLYKVDTSGNFSSLIPPFHYSPNHTVRGPGNPPAIQPQAIACDAAGDLFIQSFYTTLDGAIYSVDALSSTGVSSNISEVFQGVGTYIGIAADPQGNVFTLNVSALGYAHIYKFTTTNSNGTFSGVISSVGINVCQPFFCPVSSTAIATDGFGDFYLNSADTADPTLPAFVYGLTYVDEILLSGGSYYIDGIAGDGASGFNEDGPDISANVELNHPMGITATCTQVLIADTGNNRIRAIPPNPGTCGPSVVLALSANSALPSTPVTLTATATVASIPATGGTVSFFDGSVLLGVSQIITSSAQGGVPGTAVFTTRFGPGTHTLTAVFKAPGLAPRAPVPPVPVQGNTATSNTETLTVGGLIATQTILSAQPDPSTATNFDFSGGVFGFGILAPQGTLGLSASGSAIGVPATLAPAGFPPNGLPYTFLAQSQVQNAPTPAAAGDLNGDGIPDLVVFDGSGSTGTTFGVLLGVGDGSFQKETSYCLYDGTTPVQPGPCSKALATQPAGAIIADVNGDGIPDVIIFASSYSGPGTGFSTEPGAVLVYLGTGGGNLNPVPIVTSGFNAGFDSLTSGDVNNDGMLDLVVTSQIQQTVTVLLGHGDGTFSVSQSIPVTAPSHSVIADFDGDGFPDIVTTNYLVAGQGALNSISLLFGIGDGTFASPFAYTPIPSTSLNGPSTLLAVDLNGDGKPDLAVVNFNGVTVFLNQPGNWFRPFDQIGFAPPVNYPVGVGPETIAAGDLNGDGYPDLFIGNSDNSLSILLSSGPSSPGTFLAAQNIVSVGGSFGMVEADFNGDSVPDLALLSYSSPFFQTNILLGGTESFSPTAALQNLFVPGTGPTVVTGSYTPNPANWAGSSGSTTVRGINTLATDILSATPPTYIVYAGDAASFQISFTPAANTPSTVPPPTGVVALTATLTGGQPTVTTPTPNPYTVGFCYVPAYPGGCPVTITLPVAGTWTITAAYAGDANWAAATATPVSFKVIQVTTSISFQNANPSTATAGGLFNAEVLLNLLEFQTPTGNVNFTVTNGTSSVIVPSQSAAYLVMNSMYGFPTAIPITFPSAGTWTVTANYPGDTLYTGSSASLTVNVTGAVCPSTATLSISAPSTTVVAGQQLPFTANVTGITNPMVSWNINPAGAGSISTAGIYTAPATLGGSQMISVQIVATVTSCTGLVATTSVNVTAAPPPPTQAAVPTFSPAPGSYSGAQSITLSSTAGSTIYYTTDGTQPTASSTVYSGPISVSANETIMAFAGGTGFVSSATAAGRFSLYGLGAELIPGTLSSFIAATPVGSIPSDVAFDASGNFYVLDSGLGTITKFASGTNTNGTVIVPTGTLSNPQFFTVGVDGQTLFVSDYGNNRIVTVSQATSPATVNTLTLTGIPSPATTCTASPSATICQPTGIFAAPNGDLYVSDSGNQRVLRVTSTGTYLSTVRDTTQTHGTLFGLTADNAGNVYAVLEGLVGTSFHGVLVIKPSGSAAFVPNPLQHGYGIAVDPSGDIYVSDTYTKQVFEYDAFTLTLHAVAGLSLVSSDSGDGGPATVGTLANPLGITLDSNYNLYVADANAQTSSGGSVREVNVSQGIWNYASTADGQSNNAGLSFINPTGLPLAINSLNLAGANAADFTVAAITPFALAAGQVNTVQVAFTPGTVGTEAATITPAELFSGNPSSLAQSFALYGTGVAPYLPTISKIVVNNPLAGQPLSPATGFPGQTLNVTVTGTNLQDPNTGGSTLPSFTIGTASISNIQVVNSTTVTMTLFIPVNGSLGLLPVSVTTGGVDFQGGTATLPGGFQVTPWLPTLLGITPSSGFPGQTLTVTVTGTNLQDPNTGGSTLPSFTIGAASVSTSNIQVVSSTTVTMTLVIPPTAGLGLLPVSVTTGGADFQGGTALLPSGFQIASSNTPAAPTGQTPPISPVDSTTGASPVSLIFSNVPQPGQTSLTTSAGGPAPPSGFQLGTPPVYYMLSTTVTFTSVEICINYAGLSFTSLSPQLFHYTNGTWVLLPVVPTAAPTTVCGISPSLSPFALFQPAFAPTTTSVSAPSITYGTPASVTVSVGASGGTVMGSVSLSVDGGVASTIALSSGSALFNLGVLNAGSHSLTASFAAQGNFLGSSASGTFAVGQAPLTIAANNAARPYGANNPPLTGMISGLQNADPITASFSTVATPASSVGAYSITPVVIDIQNRLSNYSLKLVSGTITVSPETTNLSIAPSSSSILVGQSAVVTVTLTAPDMVIPIDPSVLAPIIVSSPIVTDILTNNGTCTPVPAPTPGIAACTITLTAVEPNGRTLNASFAGSSGLAASISTADLVVTAPLESKVSCINSDFRNVSVPGGSYLWFNSIFKVRDVAKQKVTISFFQSSVQFQYTDATGTIVKVNQPMPDAKIVIDPSVTSASTTFDSVNNVWITTIPFDLDDNSFLTGLPWIVPASGLPADVEPVTWCGTFASDTAGVDIGWRWAAASYSSFSASNTTLGVKPMNTDDNSSNNHDNAGTPENFKTFVIPGARGKGRMNYTGSYSGSAVIE